MTFAGIGAFFSGISPKVWKILGAIAAILFVLWLLNRAIDSYGDNREQDGVNKERAAWEEADRQVQIKVAKAQTEATLSAVKREARHTAEVAKERKQVNEAVAEGRSPFDVLFGS